MEAGKLSLEDKQAIVTAIHDAELGTSAELRVNFSYREDENDIFAAAKSHFDSLGMHQTHERNGMLLYINPKVRKFTVYGDEGIHQKVKQEFWDKLSAELSSAIREKSVSGGVVHAVGIMGNALKEHFPSQTVKENQLPDDVSESE